MDKTLLKKLTAKPLYIPTATLAHFHNDDLVGSLKQEMRILDAAAKDLLQPRPEAIDNIMKLARVL